MIGVQHIIIIVKLKQFFLLVIDRVYMVFIIPSLNNDILPLTFAVFVVNVSLNSLLPYPDNLFHTIYYVAQ
jgi:hypothetical protein